MRLFWLVPAAVVALALAPSAGARDTYCSKSGDFCTSTKRIKGVVVLRVGTFSFTGRVRICVTDPTAARICHSFKLRKAGPLYEVKIRWGRHYPKRGQGTYRVGFFLGSTRLGPVLSFEIAQ